MKVIFFDGVCILCNSFINFIIDHDKEKIFQFSPIHSTLFLQTFPSSEEISTPDSIFFLDEKEKLKKSTAILQILFLLFPRFRNIFLLLTCIPEQVRDFFYDFIAKNRYRIFGKKISCRISDKSIHDRFI
ncbi:MAG: DCC1-like thiol-disulfide oxidoreductase family protein [Leptospiraceae bacterium]|nr:DUF393 domain-containing protein [Leptospiraceae bacterium]MCK6379674.1 DCC1-like thiol-disulfide oxidoreductase family protein [Leptospiraceae bacterium]NUM42058.1 DUF393 domain-containing protein [Leptospiraceae bacterium]